MKLKTFTFFKHKTYLFSFIVLMLGSILYSLPAYSQVDYYYGINKKGFRLGIGVGADQMQSYWTTSTIGYAARLNFDYDLNLYTSIGIEGSYGTLGAEDSKPGKLYYAKDAITYTSGSIGFKVAVGQFSHFEASNKWKEAVKRLYIGAGVGMVQSTVTLTKYNSDGSNGTTAATTLQSSSANSYPRQKTDPDKYIFVPLNLGTYIALRGLLGNDRLELNPNFGFNLVLDPLFTGFVPNTQEIPASASGPAYNKTGNPSYSVVSIGLRYKF